MFYCFSLHVSGNFVLIIRRKYRTYATPGICLSIWMTVWYAEPCIPDSHPYRVTPGVAQVRYFLHMMDT